MGTLLHTTFDLFDTTNSIKADCSRELLDEAVSLCEDFHRMLSIGDSGSDIYAINHAQGNFIDVSEHTASLLAIALEVASASDGAFNPAIGSASKLWDYRDSTSPLPSQDDIDRALRLIDWHNIELENTRVRLPASMRIDVGGIAKGYIADMVALFLRSNGVSSAFLDFGGNVVVVGNNPQGNPWRIGLQLPGAKRKAACWAYTEQQDATVVTSGTYERGYRENGVSCHHLIDPRTGKPAEHAIETVTLIGKSSCYADALSTACFILGAEQGIPLATRFGFHSVFLMTDGTYKHNSECPLQVALFATESRECQE